MNDAQNNIHICPMKKHWQYINQILGFWMWPIVIVEVFISRALALILPWKWIQWWIWDFPWPWKRRVLPAFRKMMTGVPQSYLRVSEIGLEYRNWPFIDIRCRWEDVKCIRQNRWFGNTLCLQRAEEFGFSEFSINLSPPQIHLSSLEGWQDGRLKDDLRKYVPQLFRKT